MRAELLAFVQAYGGEGLPWVGKPEWPAGPHGLQVRQAEVGERQLVLELVADSGTRYIGVRLYAPYDGLLCCREKWALEVGKYNHEVAAVLASMRREFIPDPRLAALPEEARKIVAEFFDLHQAWDTEWTVDLCANGKVILTWGAQRARAIAAHRSVATFSHTPEPREGVPDNWLLTFGGYEPYTLSSLASGYGPLRRSADFAEFVQRFKRAEGEVQP